MHKIYVMIESATQLNMRFNQPIKEYVFLSPGKNAGSFFAYF